MKELVRTFWEAEPCGTRELDLEEGTRAYFDALERERDRIQPFIVEFAGFDRRRGQRVLEIGVGPGTDLIRFARSGAILTGVDLTDRAVGLARRRLQLEGLSGDVLRADAEALPFAADSFDFVYSWGVIHHTEHPQRAADEIVRVVRPGGEVCVMVYHRRSLVAVQSWIVNGLLRGQPWRSVGDLIWHYHESIGTTAYTLGEARTLFSTLRNLAVTSVVTPYDVRITRTRYAPRWVQSLVPSALGWFLVLQGTK